MTEPKTRMYESATLGVPALKMVLVHARNNAQNAAQRPSYKSIEAEPAEELTPLDKEKAIRKIIQRLEELE